MIQSQDKKDNPGSVQAREPMDYSLSKPPSLKLYLILILSVVVLIILSFSLRSQNWNNFFLNLATEITGAVIILIFVERRISGVFPGFYQSQVKAYVKLLAANLKINRMVLYMSRPHVENKILELSARGFILSGGHHCGKTILLQFLTRYLADDFLRNPKENKVPVMAPFHDLDEGDPVHVLKSAMQSHFALSDSAFRRLLRHQRLSFILDGLDELVVNEVALQSLFIFHQKYPGIPLIIAATPLENDPLKILDLPVYMIPAYSEAEREKIMKIEERMKY